MTSSDYIRWFDDLGIEDVASVGGKTASLGELYSALSGASVKVPRGFAITAQAYRDALTVAGAWAPLHELLDGLHKGDVDLLAERAAAAREIVYAATGGEDIRRQIVAAYRDLKTSCGGRSPVAVRSSATAEDLPTASFAGQHES
ncbi:MAG: PEP/pyruvate-binding domain-containing protein, partial [Caulobacteraceae bacterium]